MITATPFRPCSRMCEAGIGELQDQMLGSGLPKRPFGCPNVHSVARVSLANLRSPSPGLDRDSMQRQGRYFLRPTGPQRSHGELHPESYQWCKVSRCCKETSRCRSLGCEVWSSLPLIDFLSQKTTPTPIMTKTLRMIVPLEGRLSATLCPDAAIWKTTLHGKTRSLCNQALTSTHALNPMKSG